jgi:carbamoyl-phosphate synthase large subunit
MEKINNMNILITGVGGPTPRSFAKALKRFGNFCKDALLVGTDINPLSYGLYDKSLFDFSYVIPTANHSEYWHVINGIAQKHKIDIAVIMPEYEVMEWSLQQENGQLPCKVLIPASKLNSMLIDKAAMTACLQPMDLVPKSFSFNRNELNNVSEKLFELLGSEFWVRSSSGTSGLGSLKISSPNTLHSWVNINAGVDTFLASTFLKGRNLACKLLYWQGKLLRSACAERVNYIMSKVAPSRITGNTSFGRLLNEPNLVDTAVRAMDILFDFSNAPKHGFFTVDFKEDEHGKPYITEVNVRHVAFTQCFAAAGANFAEDTVRLLLNDELFDKQYKMYEFEPDTIFLRDVDDNPIIMKETELLNR